MKTLLAVWGVLLIMSVDAFEYPACFARGKWEPADFIMVKGPRWEAFNQWEQMDDHIVQKVPPAVTDAQLQGPMHADAYVAMCYGKKLKLKKKLVCSSVMSFDHRMAPLIVIAPVLGKHPSGVREFREHWEIVLYDQGLNVWKHMWKDGVPSWIKHSYLLAPYKKRTKYELKVTVSATAKGQTLEVECDGRRFGCHLPGLGKEFYFGIIGCEGRNRFYDFKISEK
ncbi:MAG: hypothetical protein IJY46_09300 [Lentisphaeria bacterium]|nr:hypothetical protein [Lentisphaeria bacterium]